MFGGGGVGHSTCMGHYGARNTDKRLRLRRRSSVNASRAASRESGDGMAGIRWHRWKKTPRWAPSTGNKRDPQLYMEL